MKWLKAIGLGLRVMNEFMDAAEDGKISVREILYIGIEAAESAGYAIEDVEWELFDEQDLKELTEEER